MTSGDKLLFWMFTGIAMLLGAGAMIALGWPRVEVCAAIDYGCGKTKETGSIVFVVMGSILAMVGQILVLIGAIGIGVKNGTLAAREDAHS